MILTITALAWLYLSHWATWQLTGLGLQWSAYWPGLIVLIVFTWLRQFFSRNHYWLILEQGLLVAYCYGAQIIKLRWWGWPLMPNDLAAGTSFYQMLGSLNRWWPILIIIPLVIWLVIIIANWQWPSWIGWLNLVIISLVVFIINQWPSYPLMVADYFYGNSSWDQPTNYAQRGPWLYLTQEYWRQRLTWIKPTSEEVQQAMVDLDYQPTKLVIDDYDRPNIYLIVVESFYQPDLPALQLNRSAWADDWQALANQGLGQALSPVFGGKTANAEFEILCGWPNLHSGIIFNGGIKQTVPCLPNYLRQLGYQTNAFHANVPAFWQRHQIYPRLGFNRFYSLADYHTEDMNGEFMADSSFYQQTLDHIQQQGSGQPQFNYLLTISSHLGYPLNDRRRPVIETESELTEVALRYLNSLYYSTQELADFLEQLAIIDPDAVVMVVGDHWPFLGDNQLGYRQGGWWPETNLTAEQVWQRATTPLWGRQTNQYWLKDQVLNFYQLPDALWQQLGFGPSPFATWSARQPANWRPLDSIGEPGVLQTVTGYYFCYPQATDSHCQAISQRYQAAQLLLTDIFTGQQISQQTIDETK